MPVSLTLASILHYVPHARPKELELELDLSVCLPDRLSPAQPKALEARALTRQASAKATVDRETSQKRKIGPLVREQ